MSLGDIEDRGMRHETAPPSWKARDPRDVEEAFTELDHPADLLLEVRGDSLPHLFENALYGLYYHLADLPEIEAARTLDLEAEGPTREEALRALLGEAVYNFDTQGFVAVGAEVTVSERPSGTPEKTGVHALASLIGGILGPSQPALTEVKAVTYHQLAVGQTEDGRWQATVLFDV